MAAKVLLVEDDNNLREIYEARLEAEGYTIVTAKDGEEALVVAKAEKPDLVVSDVMMPRISGFEMLDILRNTAELKDTKVIMLTALGQAEDQTRATSLGADRYLIKSQVTLEDIVKAAHDLIEGATAAPASASAAPVPVSTPGITTPAATPAPTLPSAPAPPQSPVLPPKPPVPTSMPTPLMPVHDEPTPQVPPRSEPSSPVPAPPANPVPAPPVPPAAATPPAPVPPIVASPAPSAPAVEHEKKEEESATPAPANPLPAHDASAPEAEAEADATPTADEQAAMHTQIEDFINNNLTHPEASSGQRQAAPEVHEAPVPAPASSTPDDALLANAVKDLGIPNPPVTSAPEAHEAPSPAPVADAPTPKPEGPHGSPSNNSVTIANKKIIQPLKSEKPGLDELLAREEARERATSLGPVTPSAPLGPPPPPEDTPAGQLPVSPNPPVPDTPPQQPSGPDPNSIAL